MKKVAVTDMINRLTTFLSLLLLNVAVEKTAGLAQLQAPHMLQIFPLTLKMFFIVSFFDPEWTARGLC